MIFSIYLIIGFLLDLYIENILNNISPDMIRVITIGYDIDINSPLVRFVMLLVCMFGWPFIIMNVFKDN